MDIAGTLGIITNGITVAKTMRDIDKKYDEATYRAQMADLIDALSDAKLALLEARETISARDAEIDRLTKTFEVSGDLVEGDGGYRYFTCDNGQPIGWPVCPSCLNKGRISQLIQDIKRASCQCPNCDRKFSPVTRYLGNGDTALAKYNREQQAAIDAHNSRARARNPWISR